MAGKLPPAGQTLASTACLVVDSNQLAKASASVSWESTGTAFPGRPASSSHRLIWWIPGDAGCLLPPDNVGPPGPPS